MKEDKLLTKVRCPYWGIKCSSNRNGHHCRYEHAHPASTFWLVELPLLTHIGQSHISECVSKQSHAKGGEAVTSGSVSSCAGIVFRFGQVGSWHLW